MKGYALRGRHFAAFLLMCTAGCTLLTDLTGLSGGAADAKDATSDTAVGGDAAGDSTVPSSDGGTDSATADGSAYASAVLADRPIAFFRLDESALSLAVSDSAGTNIKGNVVGAVTMGVPGLLGGDAGTAARFTPPDGGTATIKIPRDVRLEPASAITVEAWVRVPAVVPPSGQFSLVSYGNETPNENYVLYATHNIVAFYIGRPGGSTTSKQAYWNLPLSADTTYHFVGTYDGSTIALYANGMLVATQAASGDVAGYDGVTGLAIGSIYDGYYGTTGTVDEVAIYGSALAADRVSAHYLAGK